MFAIYLIVAAVILACGFYYAGQWERPARDSFFDDEVDILKCTAAVAVFWPIVVVLIIVLGPFGLLFYLGARKKAKRKAEKESVDSKS